MKKNYFLALWIGIAITVQAGEFEILSLTSNGRLTFTNTFTNGTFTVEWASQVPTTNWNSGWAGLRDFAVTGKIGTVETPMYYRIKCNTNLFIPTIYARQFEYSISSGTVAVGTGTITFLNNVTLSTGKEYTLMELNVPNQIILIPCRSTASEFYTIPTESKNEVIEWQNGSSGTTWTNSYGDGSSDKITIIGTETITVPAGTFNCIKIEKREINNNLRLRYVDWIKPGFNMIKEIDYGNGSGQPTTLTLKSWTDKASR